MMNQLLLHLSLTQLIFHFHFNTTLAQSPVALPVPAVSPTAPPVQTTSPNIIKILEKGSHFTLFVRLLKSTHVGDQINDQLKDSNNELTVFAPSDKAFSSLASGTINSLNDEQQVELVQFHFVLTFISTTLFQTVSNPLRTQAGDTGPGQFPLNVTISGNKVMLSTGVMNTTVSGTIYSDNQLAVYQVDDMLLPWNIFSYLTKNKTPAANSPSSIDGDVIASGQVSLNMHGITVMVGVGVVAVFLL